MLEIKNLSKCYDELIIDDLSLNLSNTGLVVIVGESGCGKTTLLNIIGGIDQDYTGEVIFDNYNIKEIKNYCRKHVGFIFQNFNLINWLTVKENYLLPKFFSRIIHKRIIENQVGLLKLTKILRKKPNTLSGGQKQKVAMLRAMVKNVDLLLCDEPTGSLDDESAKVVFEVLKKEAKERLVIVITHNEQLAKQYADEMYIMKNGKLMGDYQKKKNENFYHRLKEKKKPLNIFNLALLQYRSNLMRNLKITSGVMLALICIMITFTLSGSLHSQIKKQLNNIFPNQLISMQEKNRQPFKYRDLLNLKNNSNITYMYGEMKEFEFIGVSLLDTYQMEKTVYIADMTKEIKADAIELGKRMKNDNEIILSKTTAMHLNKNYQKLLNKQIYGYYLHNNTIKQVKLKIVGITNEITAFDTIYINELANVRHVEKSFGIDINSIDFSIGMINISNRLNIKNSLRELKNNYSNFNFKNCR